MAKKRISVSIEAKDYATQNIEKIKRKLESISKAVKIPAPKVATPNLSSVEKAISKTARNRVSSINVNANTSRAEHQINDLQNKIRNMGSGGGMLTSFIGGLAGGAIIGAAQAGMEALKNTVLGAKEAFIGYNATMENTEVAFTSMLGSAEQAKKVMADLKNLASRTPFEFKDIAPAAQQLKAFGFSAKELIPTLTAAGNAAAGLGKGTEGLKQITFVLGQIRSTGKLMGQDVMQLSALGIPVKEILAKNLGLTADQLANVGAQGIDAKTAIDALTKGMNERFPNMMEKMSNTYEGMMSTIRDSTAQILGKMGEGLFNSLKDKIAVIRDLFSTMLNNVNAKGLSHIFDNILPDRVTERITHVFNSISQFFVAIQPGVENFIDRIKALWEILFNAQSTINGWIEKTTVLDAALTVIANTFNVLSGVMADVVVAFAYVQGALLDKCASIRQAVVSEFTEAKEVITHVWQFVLDYTSMIWENIKAYVSSAVSWIASTIQSVFNWVKNTIRKVFNNILRVFSSFFGLAGSGFVKFCNKYMNIAKQWLGSLWDFICNWVNGILERLGSVGTAIKKIGAVVGMYIDDAVDFFKGTHTGKAILNFKIIDGSTATDTGTIDGAGDDDRPPKSKKVKPPTGDGGSKGRSSNHAAESAQRAAEEAKKKIEEAAKKISELFDSLEDKFVSETGTTYQKSMVGLKKTLSSMRAEMNKAMALGINTDALQSKLEQYEKLMKDKFLTKLKQANEDLVNSTRMAQAQLFDDKRQQAEVQFAIDKSKLEREKVDKLKEVAMTKDSAEAKLRVEEWFNAQLGLLQKKRQEELSKTPQTFNDAWKSTLQDAYAKLKDKGAQLKSLTDDIFNAISTNIETVFKDVLTGNFDDIGKAFKDMLKSMLSAIAKFLANQLVLKLLNSVFHVDTNGFNPFGTRATGGPVAYGKSYLVGENGPEIFRPHQAGRIDNNLSLGGGSQPPMIKLVVNNNSGTPLSANYDSKFDGSRWVTSVMLDAIHTNKDGIRDVIKGVG